MTPEYDEAEVRRVLGSAIQENGDLYDLGWYLGWVVGKEEIVLDGRFTVSDLKAICYYVEHMGGK